VLRASEQLRAIVIHVALLAYTDTNVDKPILYHNICKSSHVRNYKKRSADVEITPEMEASPVKSRLRSESAFQWKKNCFLCGGECLPNDAYYRKVEKSMVEGQDRAMMVDTSIRHAIVERDRDAWAREVSDMIHTARWLLCRQVNSQLKGCHHHRMLQSCTSCESICKLFCGPASGRLR